MNQIILKDVMKLSGDISPLSVVTLMAITLVGAVLMILLCSGCMMAMKKLWKSLFDKKD